jgi:tetratricopeptide (TPR) repeat protein
MTAIQALNIGSLRASHRALILIVSLIVGAPAFAQGNPIWSSALADGSTQRAQGNLTLALECLEAARRAAGTPSEQAQAAGEFGSALVQARRYDEAEVQLRQAYDFAGDIARARYAADLGNLAALRNRPKEAERYYLEARTLAKDKPEIELVIDLNRVRLIPEKERLAQLDTLFPAVETLPDSRTKALLYLNIGIQARVLGTAALPVAYRSLDPARRLLIPTGNRRALVEVLDA